jgi:hypothetical protein
MNAPLAMTVPIEQLFIRAERMPMPVAIIQELVAAHYGVDVAELRSNHRARRIARPRQVAMVLADALTGYSINQIGQCFRRDHTTVLHAKRVIDELAAKDPGFRVELDGLRDRASARLGDRKATVALDASARDAASAAIEHYLETLIGDLRAAARRNPYGFMAVLEDVRSKCQKL